MAISDTIKESGLLPNLSGSTIWTIMFWVAIVVVVASLICVGVYFLIQYLRFNKTIKLFTLVGRKPQLLITSKAKEERLGLAGDFWWKTKKGKILPRGRIQMAKNEYWYYQKEDGEWVNFGLDDIDEQLKKAGAKLKDEDMSFSRIGIQRNLKDRLQAQSWWDKHGQAIMTIIFVIILSVMLIMVMQKMAKNWEIANRVADSNLAIAKQTEEIAKNLENIAQRIGGGTVPVTNAFIGLGGIR